MTEERLAVIRERLADTARPPLMAHGEEWARYHRAVENWGRDAREMIGDLLAALDAAAAENARLRSALVRIKSRAQDWMNGQLIEDRVHFGAVLEDAESALAASPPPTVADAQAVFGSSFGQVETTDRTGTPPEPKPCE